MNTYRYSLDLNGALIVEVTNISTETYTRQQIEALRDEAKRLVSYRQADVDKYNDLLTQLDTLSVL